MYIGVKSLTKYKEINPKICKKDNRSWPGRIYTKNARLTQHSKVNVIHYIKKSRTIWSFQYMQNKSVEKINTIH